MAKNVTAKGYQYRVTRTRFLSYASLVPKTERASKLKRLAGLIQAFYIGIDIEAEFSIESLLNIVSELLIKSWHGDIVVVKLRTALGLSRALEYSYPLTFVFTTIVNFTILGLV